MSKDKKVTYEHFILGESTAVRVTIDSNGLKRGAEIIDPLTGELVIRPTLLSRIETSDDDVKKIDHEQFQSMQKNIKKKSVIPRRSKRPKLH